MKLTLTHEGIEFEVTYDFEPYDPGDETTAPYGPVVDVTDWKATDPAKQDELEWWISETSFDIDEAVYQQHKKNEV